MKKVLFICTGNTCRSPMAQALFDRFAEENGICATADSAGLAAADGLPASENSILALRELGIDLSVHRSKPVSLDLLKSADLIVCMSQAHADALENVGFNAYVLGGGVPDPFGRDLDAYKACRDSIQAAIKDIADRLC